MNHVIEKQFEYKGFPCVCILQNAGHRCGYVGLPKGNRYYGKDYDDIPIGCHGGLTFSDKSYWDDDDRWYIGFDCAHWADGKDFDAVEKYWADDEIVMKMLEVYKLMGNDGEIRTLEYVENECKEIVNQL